MPEPGKRHYDISPAVLKSPDSRTVQTALDVLDGHERPNRLTRLMPFLGPAFIARKRDHRICTLTRIPLLLIPLAKSEPRPGTPS